MTCSWDQKQILIAQTLDNHLSTSVNIFSGRCSCMESNLFTTNKHAIIQANIACSGGIFFRRVNFFANKSNMLKHHKKEMGRVKGSSRGGTLAPTPRVAIKFFFYPQSSCHKIWDNGYSNTNINKQLTSPAQNTPAPQAKANIADVSVNTLLY